MYSPYMNKSARPPAVDLTTLLHAAYAAQDKVEAELAAIGLSLAKLAALKALSAGGESMPLTQLAENLAGRPGIDMVAPFGSSLHVSGRDAAALEAAIEAEEPGHKSSMRTVCSARTSSARSSRRCAAARRSSRAVSAARAAARATSSNLTAVGPLQVSGPLSDRS